MADPVEKVRWLREFLCDESPDVNDRMRLVMCATVMWSGVEMPDDARRALRLPRAG